MAKRSISDLKLTHLHFSKLFNPERMQRLTGVGLLRRRWHEIVGPLMASHCEPVSLEPQDGALTLMIAVDHPIIAQQIRFLYKDIRIACFQQCKIQGLARVFSRVQAGAGIRDVAKAPKVVNAISFADLRNLAESLQDVEDTAIRRVMFQARVMQLKYKKT
ncbi:MAG: DciA family protein [Ghiorsea sp.]